MNIARLLVLLALVVAPFSLQAQTGGKVTAQPLSIVNDDSVVPVSVPGFELRVLDTKKRVLIELDAERVVEVFLPVYIYFPRKQAVSEQELARLAEVQSVQVDLERVLERIQDPELTRAVMRLSRTLRDYGAQAVPAGPAVVKDEPESKAVRSRAGEERVVYEQVISDGGIRRPSVPAPVPEMPPAAQPEIPEDVASPVGPGVASPLPANSAPSSVAIPVMPRN